MPDQGERMTDRALAGIMRRYKSVYQEALEDIGAKFKDYARKFKAKDALYQQKVKDGTMTEADYQYWLRGQVFNGKIWRAKREQIAETLYQADKKGMDITNAARSSVIAENANYLSYEMEKDAQMDMGFTLYSKDAVDRLIKEQPQLLPPHKIRKEKDVAWYNRLVSNSITQGIIQGEVIDAIAKRIMKASGNNLMTTAVRNARTAMTGAQNAGRIVAMQRAQDMGINVKKRWMATFDARTRDAHGALDGQEQDVDKPFESDLGSIRFPGDPTAAPANVYNCRCTLTWVYPDYNFGAVERRDNISKDVIGKMTYQEWLESKREAKQKSTGEGMPAFRIRHAVFTPAATIAEAEKFASQFLGYNGHVSYRGLSIEAANACNQTLADIRANNPNFKLSGIEPMNMRSKLFKGTTAEAAYRWGNNGTLFINPTYYKSAKVTKDHIAEINQLMKTVLGSGKELIDSGRVTGTKADYIKALLETKRQTVSQSYDFIRGTFVHEIGHALDDKYIHRELGEMYPGIDGVRNFLSQSKAEYGGRISGYAIADSREYIAESFTAWWFGERNKVDPVLSKLFIKVLSV